MPNEITIIVLLAHNYNWQPPHPAMIYSVIGSRRKHTRLTASRIRRSRLLTEVAMRKMNLDPAKSEQIQRISSQLSQEDVDFFEHIFKQIDCACGLHPPQPVCWCFVRLTCSSHTSPGDELGIMLRSELHEVKQLTCTTCLGVFAL